MASMSGPYKIFIFFNRWSDSILHSFGHDPLKCPSCGTIMMFHELYFNHKPVPLYKLYEKLCLSIGTTLPPLFLLFHPLLLHDTINIFETETGVINIKRVTEAALAKKLQEYYIKNPPKVMISDEIRDMNDNDLLDTGYSYMNLMIWMMTILVKKVFTSSDLKLFIFYACFSAGFLFCKSIW